VTVGKSVLIDSVSLCGLLIDIEVAIILDSKNVAIKDYEKMAQQHRI
jgi:hypothetical protein